MTILVTGGAGYIGSHTVLALRAAGARVVVLDDLSTGLAALVPEGVPLVRGDIGDTALVDEVIACHRVEAIVHFAGSIVVPESVADPLRYYENNTVKSRSLIASAVRGGVRRFLFSSTAAVYGAPDVVPVAEDAPLRPVSPYGWSKLMTEVMLADAARAHGFSYGALRYFNVAGADPDGRSGQSSAVATHLIKIACEAAAGRREGMAVFGRDYPTPDGTCIRDYIHVCDLADAHLLALLALEAAPPEGLVLNCGYGEGFSVLEVIAAVKRVSGVDFPVRDAERRAGDPPRLVAATGKLAALPGWAPRFRDLDTIVGHALAWEREGLDRARGRAQFVG